MAKKDEKKIRNAAKKAAKQPVKAKKTKAEKPEKTVKSKANKAKKKTKPLVRGKVVEHDKKKRLNKHKIKKTGEEVRFEGPRKVDGQPHVHVHGKIVDEGMQLVTKAAQSNVMSSMRGSARIPPGCRITFRK